ncbi:MAG: HisKA 3 protein [Chloroflexi bacterium]|nr:HisKA 3 protein [Chloroflexota bacterium]
MTVSATHANDLAAESARLDGELLEIDLLVSQARTESGRHEARRAAAAEKLAALGVAATAREAIDLATQTVTLTRRAALMDAQLEILQSKRASLVRLKAVLDAAAERLRATVGGETVGGPEAAGGTEAAALPPAVSRIVLAAQEDLRRDIARAMHDGPAQSLTNIVLQAEIVERLISSDPVAARTEVGQLVGMVQHTLEATKTFIFDVRPMVLDDLGLVPTLRRAARDRGRRAGVAVEFESMGVDRRLPEELESGLFRILDEALAAFLATKPERASLHLDWGEVVEANLVASRSVAAVADPGLPASGEILPPALAAMVEDRRADHGEAEAAARRAAVVVLPASTWRQISERAATLGIELELLDGGGRLRLTAALPYPG